MFRSFAVLFYLAGALLACVFVARMLRSWWWGMAAGVLWVGMPAGALDAMQSGRRRPLAALPRRHVL